jgi:hypothetical protein
MCFNGSWKTIEPALLDIKLFKICFIRHSRIYMGRGARREYFTLNSNVLNPMRKEFLKFCKLSKTFPIPGVEPGPAG